MKMALMLLLLSSGAYAVAPSRMGVFQQGPVGYGQAYAERKEFEAEGAAFVVRKNGREDSPLTDLTGETSENNLFAGAYIRMSSSFFFLFNAAVQDLSRSYRTSNEVYAFKSSSVNYTLESGAHFDKGPLQYGSKIAVRMFGEETRMIDDTIGKNDIRYPETQVPFLKFWAALVGTHSKLGLTLHTHNKKEVKPKDASNSSTQVSTFGRSVLGEAWLDLSMKHSETTVLAFGLHLMKRGQVSESVQDTSNVLLADDRYKSLDKDQYELLVGSEYTVASFMKIYSSLVYSFAGYADDKYASIIQDNTGGMELNSTLSFSRTEHEYLFGLSYRLAEKVDTKVADNSATKPWAGIGSAVSVGQVGWGFLFSMRTKI